MIDKRTLRIPMLLLCAGGLVGACVVEVGAEEADPAEDSAMSDVPLSRPAARGFWKRLSPTKSAAAGGSASADTFNADGVSLQAFELAVNGATVTASFALRTERAVAFGPIAVAVRDARGAILDFGHLHVTVDGAQSLAARRDFGDGAYRAWIAYTRDGVRWTDLPPERSFTVGAGAAAPTALPDGGPPAAADGGAAKPDSAGPAPDPGASGALVPRGPGGSWKLTFQDEFSGSSVDTSKWNDKSSSRADCQQGNKGNQQLEWNQMANASVAGGYLTLTARRQNVTSPCTGTTYNWTSAGLSTKYAFTFGFIEERSKQPAAKGFWPAFWTWQAPGVSSWQETDVYEYYSDNHTKLYLSSHVGSGGGCTITPAFDPSAGFHTYGADIRPDGTTWYVDGVAVCSKPGRPSALTNVITNLAVYSTIPPASTTTQETKVVDYVRVFQRQ